MIDHYSNKLIEELIDYRLIDRHRESLRLLRFILSCPQGRADAAAAAPAASLAAAFLPPSPSVSDSEPLIDDRR